MTESGLLLDYVRGSLGLPTRGLAHGQHVGWTTDRDKAAQLTDLGVHVTPVRVGELGPVASTDDRQRLIGFEFAFAVGRELAPALALSRAASVQR